jgi:hypothetical protein
VGFSPSIFQEHGGPRQYLLKRFSTSEAVQGFYESLLTLVPPNDVIDYQANTSMKTVTEAEVLGEGKHSGAHT